MRPLLWLVALGIFMQMLDSTIVNTALPAMAHDLGESPLRMQSVVVAYALAMALFIPASGWLADRVGTRRTFTAAVLLFTAGSLACALSPSLPLLVAARVLQGIGGAMLMPVGRLAVMKSVPRSEFLRAMSFVTIPALIGPLIGPTLGGWLVQVASWHWIFLINVPIGVLAAIATQRLMPDHHGSDRRAFDLAGYALLAFGMVALSVALDGGGAMALRHVVVLVLLVAGLAAMAAYWLHAAAYPAPVFPLALFSIPSYRVGILGNLFSRMGSSAMPFLLPLALQVGMGMSPLHAGLMLVPMSIAGMLIKRPAVWLVQRFGYRRVLVLNTLLVALMMASFALLSRPPALPWLILQFALFGAVNSLQFTAMNTATLHELPAPLAAAGNSLLSMVMMLSMSFGVAATGGLLTAFGGGGSDGGLLAFRAVFVCTGLFTLASAAIFSQLQRDSGRVGMGEDAEHIAVERTP